MIVIRDLNDEINAWKKYSAGNGIDYGQWIVAVIGVYGDGERGGVLPRGELVQVDEFVEKCREIAVFRDDVGDQRTGAAAAVAVAVALVDGGDYSVQIAAAQTPQVDDSHRCTNIIL